jgi:hypothetical protein
VKHPPTPQSATSLPPAPRDEANSRMTKYFVMMSVRVICFILMVVITPYGWYTWLFALGAVVLPYLAVVIANVGPAAHEPTAIAPSRALTARPDPVQAAPDERPGIIRVTETKNPGSTDQ